MHCTYSGMPKGTSRAEATSNSEKIKPVALAVIELRQSEGIRQLVSQLVSQSVSQQKIPLHKNFLKFRSNFLKAFRVDLKAWLYLTNTTPSSSGKIEVGFRVILLRGPRLLLCRPYYEPLLWFMIYVQNSKLDFYLQWHSMHRRY